MRMTGQQQAATPTFRKLDILVCDINPVWRYSAEQMLVRLGCRVVSVSTASEAIRRATGDVKFDAIIVEYRLPKSSGADISRLIHNTVNPNMGTPIITMTNFVTDATAENDKQAVFAGIIEKPLTREKLIKELEKHCAWRPKTLDD